MSVFVVGWCGFSVVVSRRMALVCRCIFVVCVEGCGTGCTSVNGGRFRSLHELRSSAPSAGSGSVNRCVAGCVDAVGVGARRSSSWRDRNIMAAGTALWIWAGGITAAGTGVTGVVRQQMATGNGSRHLKMHQGHIGPPQTPPPSICEYSHVFHAKKDFKAETMWIFFWGYIQFFSLIFWGGGCIHSCVSSVFFLRSIIHSAEYSVKIFTPEFSVQNIQSKNSVPILTPSIIHSKY